MKKCVIFAGMVALVFTGAGCVKKSEFEALQNKQSNTLAELTATQEQVVSLESALKKAEAQQADTSKKLAETSNKLAETRESLEQMEKDNDSLSGELAGVIKARTALKASAARLQEALVDLQKRKAAADARVSQYRDLLKRFQAMIDSGKLKVQIDDGRMVLVLATDILFGSGSAKLSDEGMAAISEVAGILATMSKRKFQVEGHTDNVPIRTRRYRDNWELASGRALTVVKAMVKAGMAPTSLSAASYGEYQPVMENETPEARAANRRIDIVLVPDLSSLPGSTDLDNAEKGK